MEQPPLEQLRYLEGSTEAWRSALDLDLVTTDGRALPARCGWSWRAAARRKFQRGAT